MKRVKAIILAGMILSSLFIFSSCGSIKPIDNNKAINTPQIIKPVQIIAENTATPEPVIIARDPVKRHSPMRIKTDVPNSVNIPEFYFPLDLEGVNHIIYAYVNSNNQTVYRVYAEVDEEEDGNVVNTLKGFYNAKVTINNAGIYIIETDKDEYPIDMSKESPAQYTPCLLPTKANIKKYLRDESNAAKKYEKAVENAQKKGEPLPEPTPWDGTPILSNETIPYVLPNGVKESKKGFSIYYYTNIYGEYEYRRYATSDGVTGNFYYVNEDGNIVPGSLPVNSELDFDKNNFKSGKPIEKPNVIIYRLPVNIQLSDGQTTTAYTVFVK